VITWALACQTASMGRSYQPGAGELASAGRLCTATSRPCASKMPALMAVPPLSMPSRYSAIVSSYLAVRLRE